MSLHGWRVKLPQAFGGMRLAFRQTATDGVWRVFFMRFLIAEADLRVDKTNGATVRKVSERAPGLTPV